MEALREITVWTGVEYRTPNHDYLLDGDRIVAYRPWGTAEIRVLRSGIKIDRRGRKFEPLVPNPFNLKESKSNAITVTGSKGQVYTIDPEAKTCTCPGYTYRGACKHLAEHG